MLMDAITTTTTATTTLSSAAPQVANVIPSRFFFPAFLFLSSIFSPFFLLLSSDVGISLISSISTRRIIPML